MATSPSPARPALTGEEAGAGAGAVAVESMQLQGEAELLAVLLGDQLGVTGEVVGEVELEGVAEERLVQTMVAAEEVEVEVEVEAAEEVEAEG